MVPQHPWQTIYADHARFGKYPFLVTTNIYLKRPEVHIVSSTSAQTTIDKLRMVFAARGLPMALISNIGFPFQSKEFNNFISANGINHCHVLPYHPSSNGLAENMVKTVNWYTLNKCKTTKDATIETHIARFLASYCNTQYSVCHCYKDTSRTTFQLST